MGQDIRFLLNLQMIADDVALEIEDTQFFAGEDRQCLEGICFLLPKMELDSRFAYLASAKELVRREAPNTHCSLIVAGEVPEEWKKGFHTILQKPDGADESLPESVWPPHCLGGTAAEHCGGGRKRG